MATCLYNDDVKVGEVTREAFERSGSRLLQIHRLAVTDQGHANKLLQTFDPKPGARIADVGCGVGRLAELMKERRPDLRFILINKSAAQLGMCSERFKRSLGRAEELPLERGEVDAIMVTYVLGLVDLWRFLEECQRLLTPYIYVYDLFRDDPAGVTRLEEDLGYTERTVNEMANRFGAAGFKASAAHYTRFVPKEIAALMPRTDTLRNTLSAAIVFELK